MRLFEVRDAIKVFFYLMAVDGNVSAKEIACLDEIGNELDGENYSTYKDAVIDECNEQLQNIIDEEDYYEVALEGVDSALAHSSEDVTVGVSTRLLIWNMLVIAFSNDEYSKYERRLIKHIVRTTEPDKSVFLEMEQLIKTNIAVTKELEWIEQSQRPYSEIRPIVEELEKRRAVIIRSATELIQDSSYLQIEKLDMPKSKIAEGMGKAAVKIGEVVNPVASTIGETADKLWGGAKAKFGEAAAGAGSQARKMLGKIKGHKTSADEPEDMEE